MPGGPRFARMWLILGLARNMSWLRKSGDYRYQPLMKIFMVWMATIIRGLKLLSPILAHYSSWTSYTSTTLISLKHNEYILVESYSLTFFYLIKRSHVCIQLLFTLSTFYVIFILFPTPCLPCFCLVLCSIFINELEAFSAHVAGPCLG